MELVEVILQGVRGAPQQVRWTFPSGASVVAVGESEELLARAAFELLSGTTEGTLPAAVLPANGGGSQARAGVVVVGREQRRFRLLWDLANGRRALQAHKNDSWETVTTTGPEITQAVTSMIGVPQADALREVLFAFVDDLPSRRRTARETSSPGRAAPGKAAPRTAAALAPGFEGNAGRVEWADRPDDELRARLAELQRLAEANEAIQQMEFELAGLQKEAFDLDARVKPLRDQRARLDETRAALTRDARLDELPDDFPERLAAQTTAETELGRTLARLDDDERRVRDSARDVPAVLLERRPRPSAVAVADPLLRVGLGVGIAAIVVGVVGVFAWEPLRWLALLDIPAFGVAVAGGFRVLGHVEDGQIVRGLLERIAHERSREKERVTIERENLDRLVQRAGFRPGDDGTAEYHFTAHRARKAELTRAVEQLDDAERAANLAELQSQREALQLRIRVLEKKLESDGGNFDVQSGERARERAEIEAVLRERRTRSAGGVSSSHFEENASSSSPGFVPVDVGQIVTRLASDLLGCSLDEAGAQLAPRVSQMIVALLGRRFAEVRFGPRGEVSLIDGVSREALGFVQLTAADRDLVVVALRLAVLEMRARRERAPLIFDRSLDHLPPESMPLLARALQFLGKQCQVVCLTRRNELASVGPRVVGSLAG
jgi:hypothetical protein